MAANKSKAQRNSGRISAQVIFGELFQQSRLIAFAYLAIIIVAELVTNFSNPQGGVTFYSFILAGLIIHASLTGDDRLRPVLLGLCLAPLVRVFSLAMPLGQIRQIYWYPIIYTPLITAAVMIMRSLDMSFKSVGFLVRQWRLQLLVAVTGVGLGALEYVVLRPKPLISELTWSSVALPALILIVFTGFAEEFMFRGVLQTASGGLLGVWGGIVYVSILFAVLHVGYRSVADVFLVFGIAIYFAAVVKKSGSLLGVTLAHGFTNSMLSLVLPHVLK